MNSADSSRPFASYFPGALNEQCMMFLVIHRHLSFWQSSVGEVGRKVIVRRLKFLSHPSAT